MVMVPRFDNVLSDDIEDLLLFRIIYREFFKTMFIIFHCWKNNIRTHESRFDRRNFIKTLKTSSLLYYHFDKWIYLHYSILFLKSLFFTFEFFQPYRKELRILDFKRCVFVQCLKTVYNPWLQYQFLRKS